jgi:serine/threonine protein kinase
MNNSITPGNETIMNNATANDVAALRRLESRQFTYKELEMITNDFQQVLGQGGFGCVYNGFLEDGTQVAVKLRSHFSNQGAREFLAEVKFLIHQLMFQGSGDLRLKFDMLTFIQAEILTRIHHMNLVSMIGYCMDGAYMALVYEYMSEGTLEEHIKGM